MASETSATASSDTQTDQSVTPLLDVRTLTMQFMGIRALESVSFQVAPATLHAIIGPNGAGKTTTMNCIGGVYIPTEGGIWFQGDPLPQGSPHRVAASGIARTFQHAALFDEMSVRENILCGTYQVGRAGFLAGAVLRSRSRQNESRAQAAVEHVMDDLGLTDLQDTRCDVLPLGHKKRVDLARAMVQDPTMLLLDEPLAGLSEDERDQMRAQIVALVRERGMTVLMIEHDMKSVMAMADRITVLDFGRKIADGAPSEVRSNPDVVAAYLGAGASDLGDA